MAAMPWGSMKIWPSSLPRRADRVAVVVVRAPVPGAVPAVGRRRRGDGVGAGTTARRERVVAPQAAIASSSCAAITNSAAMNTDSATPPVRFGRRLERLAGLGREGVQVEAVVPVRAADERQAVGPEPGQRVLDGAAQVVVQRRLAAGGVVVRDGLVEDRPVAGLLEIGGDREHEPQRVVVEPRPDGVVAALRERLVLVVGAAVGQLRRGDVEQARAGAVGEQVHEPQQVLGRVPEAHPAADPGLEQRRRPRQVERHHALVRVPGVDHPVDVLVAGDDAGATPAAPPTSRARRRRPAPPRPAPAGGR